MYADILLAPSHLSYPFKKSTLDIVQGISYTFVISLTAADVVLYNTMQWPSVKLVCDQITYSDDNIVYEYQGTLHFNYSVTTLQKCCDKAIGDLSRLKQGMLDRLEWTDPHLLNAILTILDTQHWQETASTNLEELKVAMNLITTHFRLPLESKGVCFAVPSDELEAVLSHVCKEVFKHR